MSAINPHAAASAYANNMNIGKLAAGVQGVSSDGASFLDILKDNAVKSIDTIKSGEQMSAKAVSGQADLIDVVQAVASAELTLQSVVSIRDPMINAYQEIMRMPI